MLEYGVRPWELEAFTPDEEKALHRHAEASREVT